MQGVSLKARATLFASGACLATIILGLAALSAGVIGNGSVARATVPSIACAVLCWIWSQRSMAADAAALDAAIDRLTRAGEGNLESDVPPAVFTGMPRLAVAMRGLFRQLATTLESVHRLALYDPVTGLPNRVHFRREAESCLDRMPPDARGALMFIDLDRFKAVNDTMGHASGDMLLGMVAQRLSAVAERAVSEDGVPPPVTGRLAGDEFTMFFPEMQDLRQASRIGRWVLFALSEPFHVSGAEVRIGASIGIALRPDHGTTLAELMRAADAAMYHAKASGRGRTEHFNDVLAAEIAERVQLEADLREALDRDQFSLVFQPQLSLTDHRVTAAEALLRWRHPAGVKLPGSFIRRAEETGLIVEIGEWVIAEVAATIARWSRQGVRPRLAINLSARQLEQPDFFRHLRAALHDSGAPAALLELEISETLAMHCSSEVIDAIADLRADGATIAIDNFGTGYTNLARLRQLPVDRIKLDRSLVETVASHAETRAITQAVVGLIHGLGCEVVAEGIESDAQAQVLRVIGCDVVQGYAVSEPLEEAAFLDWVRGTERATLSA